jgi:hypothetical protein
MAKNVDDPSERRRWPRKPALISAVVADLNGENACDCSIRDISAGGAQITLSRKLPTGAKICLLDPSGRLAHVATVAWSNSNRAGLMFHQSHVLGAGLPPGLKFIWRLALEAKLKEIEGVIEMGVPAEQACSSVGFAEDDLHQMARQADGDEKFELVLHHAKRLLNK